MLSQHRGNRLSDRPAAALTSVDPSGHFEVVHPPSDTVSALSFCPSAMQKNFLVAGSWDNSVRCWDVEHTGKTTLASMQFMSMPILDVCWSDDSSKVFMASCDKQVKCWDLGSNQTMQVANHDAPVKTCHWIKAPMYTCLMTGSWDKTLKFWDVRCSNPLMTIDLPERVYCADVDYPIAVIGTATKNVAVYKLDGRPEIVNIIDSILKYQYVCVAILRDEKKQLPSGFGIGSIEGSVAIQYIEPQNLKNNHIFNCHRQNNNGTTVVQDIYSVNDIKIHPVHGTLATVGSDGTFAFWNRDSYTPLKSSKIHDQPITKCCFNSDGQIFAYSTGYDWSKGHEYNNPAKKPQIFLSPCFDDLKPK